MITKSPKEKCDLPNVESSTKTNDDKFRYKAGLFLAGVAGASAIIGFSSTLAAAKKKDPRYFSKGALEMTESGAALATRALGWGTLYAFSGCGILFYAIWKLSGATNAEEFRNKMGSILPKIPKNDPPRGRTDFSGLNDLLDYLQREK